MAKYGYKQVNNDLFLWFTQQRQKGVQVNGAFVQIKASIFHKAFTEGEYEFTPNAD
jgi:hypothetical protein